MERSKSINRISPTIVQISLFASGLSAELQKKVQKPVLLHILGTGFFVNSDAYVITARHVIIEGSNLIQNIQATSKKILVGLSMPNTKNMRANFSLVDFEVIDEDVNHDLILIKLKKNPFKHEIHSSLVINGKEVPLLYGIPTFNSDRQEAGLPIGISGYPLNETILVNNSGWIATSWSTSFKNIKDAYLGDIEINQGDSGAPVYLIEDSSIIGLCVAMKRAPVIDQQNLGYSSGLSIIVPTCHILDLLDKNKISYKVKM